MILNKIKVFLTLIILIFFLTANIIPIISGNVNYLKKEANSTLNIDHLSTNSAFPGDSITIYGTGFGINAGHVILTGLKIEADSPDQAQLKAIEKIRNDDEIKSIWIKEGQKEPPMIFAEKIAPPIFLR